MANSKLVSYTNISPHRNPREAKISKITPHHAAGKASLKSLGALFQTKRASANYGIDSDGNIGMFVEEKDRAWTSGDADNDHCAVTIEVANDGGAPDWHVSDKALAALIELCVDICKRNGIKALNFTGDANGNLTMHKMFEATACPGPYLESKFPYIATEVNKRLAAAQSSTAQPTADTVYTVKSGDTLSGIAAKYGTTYQKLAAYNGIANPNLIHVGQKIKIPSAASKGVPNTPEEGDTVRLKAGAKTYTGGGLASFVYDRNHILSELSGDRAVITYGGTVVAAVKLADLVKV